MQAKYREIAFSDSDVVNPDDFVPAGESNPHNVRPFLLHDHGFVLAVAFADSLQDALDIAADAGKLAGYEVQEDELGGYVEDDLSFLGNHCKPHDVDGVGAVELPNPPFSFAALFSAAQDGAARKT